MAPGEAVRLAEGEAPRRGGTTRSTEHGHAAALPSVIGRQDSDFTNRVCGIVRRAAARNVSFRDASRLGHLISNAKRGRLGTYEDLPPLLVDDVRYPIAHRVLLSSTAMWEYHK
jgi:hypothetical protein